MNTTNIIKFKKQQLCLLDGKKQKYLVNSKETTKSIIVIMLLWKTMHKL
jgi:hypothetical protein